MITRSAPSPIITPPAPALPPIEATTSCVVHAAISRHTALMALMFIHASSSGWRAASITFRWMPLENTSPPRTTSTRVSCATA